MRFRYLSLPIAAVCLHATIAARPVWAQNEPPKSALITAVQDTQILLGIGANDGAVRGAIYGIVRNGRVQARVQVLEVRPDESTARIIEADDDFIVSVGDSGQFIAVQDVVAPTPVETPPVVVPPIETPPVVTPPVETPMTETPVTVVPPTATVTGTSVPATVSAQPMQSMIVTAIDDNRVTFGAGADRGVSTNTKIPITRNGEIIGIARIQIVEENQSRGEIVWTDPTAGTIQVGDNGTLMAPTAPVAGSNIGPIVIDTTGNNNGGAFGPIPTAPIKYETGASNAVVPFNTPTYELLASLASSKLITQYPAQMFHDDGVRQHRSAEDLTLSRAEIAALVKQAINNADAREQLSGKERASLQILTREYRPELQTLGVPSDDLSTLSQGSGFTFGISGQTRLSGVFGDTDNVIEPFSERQGGRRSRSGFDTGTNIFGTSGDKLGFFAQIDGGSDARKGSNDNNFEVRRAFVDYNASKLLRGLSLRAGRDEVWWGPGHFGTLLLGDTAGPLNSLQTSFKRGSYQLDSLYAPLDTGPLGGRRSLYGHNLQVRIGKQTRLGIAETLFLPKDTLDPIAFLSTFSPIPLFTTERLRKRNTAQDNGNSLVQAYIEHSVARGVRGWGELLVDDIGVNTNNLLRNRIGTLLGFHLFTPRDPARLGAFVEYANLQGRTYLALQNLSDSDYFYRSRPLGYPVAPPQDSLQGGAESLRLEAYWRIKPKLRIGGGIEFADLGSEQTNLSRQQTLRLRAAYDFSRSLTLVGRLQRVATDRVGGVVNNNSKQNLFQIELVRSF